MTRKQILLKVNRFPMCCLHRNDYFCHTTQAKFIKLSDADTQNSFPFFSIYLYEQDLSKLTSIKMKNSSRIGVKTCLILTKNNKTI